MPEWAGIDEIFDDEIVYEECGEPCDNPDEPGEEWYDLAGEGSFSWSQCDSCGTTLGGDRFPAHAFFEDDRDWVLHLDIYADCVMYHTYGDVPEEVGNLPR